MAPNEAARAKFPHLLPGETLVWRAFLKQVPQVWDRYEYDVHVGGGSLPQDDPAGVFQKNFQHLTRKRIDVVGWKDRKATIFEVRARASLPLMGQLLGYRALWMRQNPEVERPALAMVCTFIQPDDRAVFRDNQILVFVVEAPGAL